MNYGRKRGLRWQQAERTCVIRGSIGLQMRRLRKQLQWIQDCFLLLLLLKLLLNTDFLKGNLYQVGITE